MAQPTLMQINRVPVADVIERDRLRPVSEAGVQSLIASIEEVGVMKDAIHVRKKKDGKLYLMAGSHRLEVARRLGWPEIEAKVWTDVTDDWARLIEIDDNLAGAEMNALDTAVFLASRKAVYERLHPETRAGLAGAVARWDATDTMSVAFVTATAEKFGLSDRHIRRLAAAGTRLGADEVAKLRAAPRPVTLKDLTEIGKIERPTDRYDVVRLLAQGEARSAADAMRSLKPTALGAEKDPVEDAFKALASVWERAPKAARKRFVEKISVEAIEMLGFHIGIDMADGKVAAE